MLPVEFSMALPCGFTDRGDGVGVRTSRVCSALARCPLARKLSACGANISAVDSADAVYATHAGGRPSTARDSWRLTDGDGGAERCMDDDGSLEKPYVTGFGGARVRAATKDASVGGAASAATLLPAAAADAAFSVATARSVSTCIVRSSDMSTKRPGVCAAVRSRAAARGDPAGNVRGDAGTPAGASTAPDERVSDSAVATLGPARCDGGSQSCWGTVSASPARGDAREPVE